MHIAFHEFGETGLNAYGGGEGRWAVNWAHFLQYLGHTVSFPRWTEEADFDLCLMADERCHRIVDKPHIHLSFSAMNPGLFGVTDCYKKHGRMIIANPYKTGMSEAKGWAEEHRVTQVFLPMCYPDHLLPSNLAPGFQRTELTWATKDAFNPLFCSVDSPSYFRTQSAIKTLKAFARFGKKTGCTTNILVDGFLRDAPAEFGLESLLADIPNLQRRDKVPWTELVQIMGRTKLNVPVAGLCGSFLESLFTRHVPALPNDISFFPECQCMSLLPPPQVATEEDIYLAMETFWYDETVYNRALECFQDLFVDHRTDGLIHHFNETLEKIGLSNKTGD